MESPRNRARNHYYGAVRDHKCVFSLDCGSPETGTNEDSSSALVEFASGAHGTYSQVFYVQQKASDSRGARISGYEGTVEFDWYKNELRHIRHFSPFHRTETASEGGSHFGGDIELSRDFLDLISGRLKGKSRATMHMGIQSVYACLAAKASVERGRFVRVRQLGE